MVNLILMMIFAILFFIFFAYLAPSKSHSVIAFIFALLFVGTIVFAVINEAYHYGMKPMNNTKEITIVSTVPKANVLLYQELGTKKKEKIYLYRTSESQKNPKSTKADINVFNHIEYIKGKTATLKQTTTSWTYRNNIIKFFFSYPSKETEIIKITNTFYLPKNWTVQTPDSLKKMESKMKSKMINKQEIQKK